MTTAKNKTGAIRRIRIVISLVRLLDPTTGWPRTSSAAMVISTSSPWRTNLRELGIQNKVITEARRRAIAMSKSAVHRQRPDATAFALGREEWVALPSLGLPAIRAKIDTGAATSALHATAIRPDEREGRPLVRFRVHPVPGRQDIAVECEAPTIGRRWIVSSNGERELRHVIQTTIACGSRQWPIAVTLTNRVAMRNRMLLGRQAILDDMVVVPRASFRQPRLSFEAYHADPVPAGGAPLCFGLIESPDAVSVWRPLTDALLNRGHRVEHIDAAACVIELAAGASAVLRSGHPLPHCDAVLAGGACRNMPFARAVLRQIAFAGNLTITRPEAAEVIADRHRMLQTLSQGGCAVAAVRLSADAEEQAEANEADGLDVTSCLVFAGRCLAAVNRRGATARLTPAERRLAVRATRVLGLRLGSVSLARRASGPCVIDVGLAAPFGWLVECGQGGAIVELAAQLERDARAAAERAP